MAARRRRWLRGLGGGRWCGAVAVGNVRQRGGWQWRVGTAAARVGGVDGSGTLRKKVSSLSGLRSALSYIGYPPPLSGGSFIGLQEFIRCEGFGEDEGAKDPGTGGVVVAIGSYFGLVTIVRSSPRILGHHKRCVKELAEVIGAEDAMVQSMWSHEGITVDLLDSMSCRDVVCIAGICGVCGEIKRGRRLCLGELEWAQWRHPVTRAISDGDVATPGRGG